MTMNKRSRTLTSYVGFVSPAVVFYAAIVLVPFLLGVFYSFTKWNGVSDHANWIGLKNYVYIFTKDGQAWQSFWFTLRFTAVTVVLSNVIAFFFALALVQAVKSARVLRTVFFLPNVIGGIILGFLWRFIFVRGFPSIGAATGIGFFNLAWLGNAATGYWGVVIVYVWKTAGYLMVIYIAAMINIDQSLLEAARIDGATGPQMLRRIIVPLVVPAITICLFLILSWSFKVFDVVFALTHGGPYRSTEAFALNIYFEAFSYGNYGIGSAKAVIFFIIVGIVTTLQVRLTQRWEIQA